MSGRPNNAHRKKTALDSKKHEARPPRIVTKTPSVENLDLFYRFFPNARLVVVVRRGEDVVESGVRSFGWSYSAAMDKWARAGKTILRFRKDKENGGEGCIVVKYEDLQSSTETTLRGIFVDCGLDPDDYDFDRARDLPVKGSSMISGSGEAIHWRPVEKASSFKPLDRAGNWTPRMRARFSWRAGAVAEELGYPSEERYRRSAIWICYNLAAGLNLYVLTTTVLGMVQQRFVRVGEEELKKDTAKRKEVKKKRKQNFYARAKERQRQQKKSAKGKTKARR